MPLQMDSIADPFSGFHEEPEGYQRLSALWFTSLPDFIALQMGQELPLEGRQTEASLVHHTLQMLQGDSGEAFQWIDIRQQFEIADHLHVAHLTQTGLRGLLDPLVRSASSLRRLRGFADAVGIAVSKRCGGESRASISPTGQAFSHAVMLLIQDFQAEVRDLQEQVEGQLGATTTLCSISAKLARLCAEVIFLEEVVRAAVPWAWNASVEPGSAAERASHILGQLYDRLNMHSEQSKGRYGQMVLLLWVASLQPLLTALQAWLQEGRLHDPAAEFFVCANSKVSVDEPAFWHHGHHLRHSRSFPDGNASAAEADMRRPSLSKSTLLEPTRSSHRGLPLRPEGCPSFLHTQAEAILATGKSLQLLYHAKARHSSEVMEDTLRSSARASRGSATGRCRHKSQRSPEGPGMPGSGTPLSSFGVAALSLASSFVSQGESRQGKGRGQGGESRSPDSLRVRFTTSLQSGLGLASQAAHMDRSEKVQRDLFGKNSAVFSQSEAGGWLSLSAEGEAWESAEAEVSSTPEAEQSSYKWLDLIGQATGCHQGNGLGRGTPISPSDREALTAVSLRVPSWMQPIPLPTSLSGCQDEGTNRLSVESIGGLVQPLSSPNSADSLHKWREARTSPQPDLITQPDAKCRHTLHFGNSLTDLLNEVRAAVEDKEPSQTANRQLGKASILEAGGRSWLAWEADLDRLAARQAWGVQAGCAGAEGTVSPWRWDPQGGPEAGLDAALMERLRSRDVVPVPEPAVLLQQCLLLHIDRQVKAVGQRLLQRLTAEWQLEAKLAALRDVFLMGSGGLFRAFLSSLPIDQRSDAWTDFNLLNSHLQKCVQGVGDDKVLAVWESLRVHPPSTPEDSTSAADSRLSEDPLRRFAGDPMQALDSLTFTWQVKWPLELIVDHAAAQAYSKVLVFLLKVAWVKQRLDAAACLVWQGRGVWRRPSSQRLSADLQRQLLRVQHRLVHFANALQHYVMDHVAIKAWAQLSRAIASAGSLDEVIAAHGAYLASVQRHAFITSDRLGGIVAGRLQTLLALALDFCRVHSSLLSSAEHGLEDRQEALFCEKLSQLESNVSRNLVYILQVLSSKSSGSSHLKELVTRLDYNHFFRESCLQRVVDHPEGGQPNARRLSTAHRDRDSISTSRQ